MPGRETNPVPQGKTFYGSSQTIPESTAYEAESLILEGREGTFKHNDVTDPEKVLSNRTVTRRLMRNSSGITVYAGMLVIEEAGYEGKRFDGYAGDGAVAVAVAGVIDQHLGSAGCRNGDLCWVTTDGPTLAYTANQTGGFTNSNLIAVGDHLHAMSAGASTANTTGGTSADDGGKFTNWVLTGTSQETTDGGSPKKILNVFAKAMSAATSGETNTLKLINVFGVR